MKNVEIPAIRIYLHKYNDSYIIDDTLISTIRIKERGKLHYMKAMKRRFIFRIIYHTLVRTATGAH